jgi:hypothetical protein
MQSKNEEWKKRREKKKKLLNELFKEYLRLSRESKKFKRCNIKSYWNFNTSRIRKNKLLKKNFKQLKRKKLQKQIN